MIFNKRKFIPLFILNIVAIVFYFAIFSNLKAGLSKEIMFASPDSQSYMDVANWIEDGTESNSISIRPVLFPLLLLFTSKIGGIYGIWLMQFLFWILTANLIFLTIKKLTQNIYFSSAGTLLFITNLSLISVTLHALTEVTTAFLLSYFTFFIAHNLHQTKSLKFIHTILFLLVILTLIKPVFYLPLLFTILIPLPIFYFKKYKENPKKMANLILILLPLFIQIGIIKIKYDEFKVSKIASITLTDYLLTQGIEIIEGKNYETANKKANSLSPSEQKKYILQNSSDYIEIFFSNVKSNITAFSTFLIYPIGYENISMAKYMIEMNSYYFLFHQIFIFLTIILFLLFIQRKEYEKLLILFVFSALTAFYILTTGISTYQGDRLVLSSISIWIPLYAFILHDLIRISISYYKNRTNYSTKSN